MQLRCDRHSLHFAGRMIQERIIGRRDPCLMVQMKTLSLLHLSTASDIEELSACPSFDEDLSAWPSSGHCLADSCCGHGLILNPQFETVSTQIGCSRTQLTQKLSLYFFYPIEFCSMRLEAMETKWHKLGSRILSMQSAQNNRPSTASHIVHQNVLEALTRTTINHYLK